MTTSHLSRNATACRHCGLMRGAHGTVGECVAALRGERERLIELVRGRPASVQVAASARAFDRDNAAAVRARPPSRTVLRPRFVPLPPAPTAFLYESRSATVGSTAVARLAGT